MRRGRRLRAQQPTQPMPAYPDDPDWTIGDWTDVPPRPRNRYPRRLVAWMHVRVWLRWPWIVRDMKREGWRRTGWRKWAPPGA